MHSTLCDTGVSDDADPCLTTRSRARLSVRPARSSDRRLLADFFSRLSLDDLRFRFLEAGRLPTAQDVGAMLAVDQGRNAHVLAFDIVTGVLVASLMVVANPRTETAEVAIVVAIEWKGHGVGWTLLRHAGDLASGRGLKTLRSVESLARHDALEFESARGFRARPLGDDPRLILVEADLG
jgi:GNAT superfamily N-acetyltransferase